MNSRFLLIIILCSVGLIASAQTRSRALSLADYEKARTFRVKDLDKETYVKFENTYVLDRYEMRKPYFITGDDGLRKRIDLYKLIAKDSMQEMGTVVFYTNEAGKVYTAVQPHFTSEPKVWDKYFNDIDNINKEEKNFILKLSYVLSKEMSFQLYKAMNAGKELKQEGAAYGTDICFPGDQKVLMADGSYKQLQDIRSGDNIITIDANTKRSVPAKVEQLVAHTEKNYAVTRLLLFNAEQNGDEIFLSAKIIEATPNHPVTTVMQHKKIGEVNVADRMICLDERTNSYKTYTVFDKTEKANKQQKVYNMIVSSGTTVVLNGVMVLQK